MRENKMNRPLLSIVIANYNYGRFLDEAIKSVISQDMGDKVQLIICDAASTDNSVEIIKKYANGLPPNTSLYDWEPGNSQLTTKDYRLSTKITWWCSEPDGGQGAAFNKGFARAKGRFLTWLNADDVMLPGTVERLSRSVLRHPSCRWFVGGVMWLDEGMHVIKCGRGRPFSRLRFKAGDVSVWGPSSFFEKTLLDEVGGVDERFHYTMDTDLWLRFARKAHARYLPFAKYAWGLRIHAASKMGGQNCEGSPLRDPNHPKWAQLKREVEWKRSYYTPIRNTKFLRLLSISWLGALGGLLDTIRFRGKGIDQVVS